MAGEPVIFRSSKAIPDLLAGLCDEASVFPPGNMPLEQAVLTHIAHMNSVHRRLVGPFILKAVDLGRLAALTDELPVAAFPVSLTVPLPDLAAALTEAERTEALELVGLEVTVPDEVAPRTSSRRSARFSAGAPCRSTLRSRATSGATRCWRSSQLPD